ncbi:UDP-Glycosyltransferase/glycogen phosphorylase [Aspergillus campestris IBT 28561]|uniref:Alpha-1,3/1,6-mannosyltransferase ALG2 n=1 Tax=Aspergillus campestris (strain IBT 28561) TaxID=1392248 RepID=A0A2I1D0X0_ASPC2|nr:UDP-Glycosyltransferase/glycogen phosphorylase [Aspergillus campestris IBT 28561]PKY03498.1 UDP-Glycosyltransferase/glycogen phosphorylase [Aspergillus campestris IBT 28561]
MPPPHPKVVIIHPDLGIGGAERLIIDVALALKNRGHEVTIYTSHCDPTHCFEEARDGTLDVRVRGNTVFPAHVCGRLYVLMAILRQLHLTVSVLRELAAKQDNIFIIDQVPACIPILRAFGPRQQQPSTKQRILFYCHFPDQLLSRRSEGSRLLQLAKHLYRYPFDHFEGWAMSAADQVVANSRFTRGVIASVFGAGRLGDVRVVYPCVDIDTFTGGKEKDFQTDDDETAQPLWDGLKIFLSINRFERKKDLGLAIRAYHGLGAEGRRGTRLVIAGGYDNRVSENVEYKHELEALCTKLGLETATAQSMITALGVPNTVDVLFLPSVPTGFRDTLLAQARLLVYTPINEHFGIVPVEAMRAGVPVLASNTGGPLESVVEGETGWLRDATRAEEWTDVMREVLGWAEEDGRAARMAATARERVRGRFR